MIYFPKSNLHAVDVYQQAAAAVIRNTALYVPGGILITPSRISSSTVSPNYYTLGDEDDVRFGLIRRTGFLFRTRLLLVS